MLTVLGSVERACARESSTVALEMSTGVHSLATIASTAPLIGLMGTVTGISNSFRGLGAEKWTAMAAITQGLSEALLPTALGLLVALIAFCSNRHLASETETLQVEMHNASRDLVSELSRHIRRTVG
jgi:biopolymer transport protein ExbB/TolQ